MVNMPNLEIHFSYLVVTIKIMVLHIFTDYQQIAYLDLITFSKKFDIFWGQV